MVTLSNKQDNLISVFMDTTFYPHPVKQVELVETHISRVFLTGQYAYKLKKPVDFGFLNFTTLEKRLYYCQEELRLNRRFAPQIYLDVLPVYELQGRYVLGADNLHENLHENEQQGEIVDYVIKMNQFDQDCLLSHRLMLAQIDTHHIEKLGIQVARFHRSINENKPVHTQILEPIEENFTVLKSLLTEASEQEFLAVLHDRMLQMYHKVADALAARKQQGFIRECHGDLHLENIALIDDQLVLFDGIEFNDAFRWIDTMSDCAFLIMDLEDHGYPVFASHFLNCYLSETGDYQGLAVLPLYQLYRATVRAKVAALNMQNLDEHSKAGQQNSVSLKGYLKLAEQYTHSHQAVLIITHGISGSGKSWLSSQIADHINGILLRSDVERKRLFAESGEFLYTQAITDKTYQYLLDTSAQILKAGYSVIVDATFLDPNWRQKFAETAKRQGHDFYILDCRADPSIIRDRLERRHLDDKNVSDADLAIMQKQLDQYQTITSEERVHTIVVDTGQSVDVTRLIQQFQVESFQL
jgi:aminoglycoside phosphotransferase family enzyme